MSGAEKKISKDPILAPKWIQKVPILMGHYIYYEFVREYSRSL